MRKSGILLHPTSLYGKEGIGTLGDSLYEFINFLSKSKQKLWQIFPLGPTGYGDSPYQCFSAFAGNPYLIDLETLVREGYLSFEDINIDFGDDVEKINYGLIYERKLPILKKAYSNFKANDDFYNFEKENSYWLEDFAQFSAFKEYFGGISWLDWPKEYKNREEKALETLNSKLENEIKYVKFLQYIFFKQWKNVKNYANSKGIEIIGDIPIFVSMDSADAWSNNAITSSGEVT